MRKKKIPEPIGLVLADKPAGMASSALVATLKRALQGARCGHTGTLDRFASGLMVLPVGQATSLADVLLKGDKTYEATFLLGKSTDTHDPEGSLEQEKTPEEVQAFVLQNAKRILSALGEFSGRLDQIPPQFSALKQKGRRVSDLARQGIVTELAPRQIAIYENRDQNLSPDGSLRCCLKVSSGTYIRSIARDLGEMLGFPVVLSSLRRTSIGHFALSELSWQPDHGIPEILPLPRAFPQWPTLPVSEQAARRILAGGFVPIPVLPPGQPFFLMGQRLLAWGEALPEGRYRYRRVFSNAGS